MAGYRVEVIHAGYWRGSVDRWSTSYQYQGTVSKPLDNDACDAMRALDSDMCYQPATAGNGGIASVAFYASSGGTSVHQRTYFDWQVPGSWIPYTGDGWDTVTPELNTVGEAALVVEWAGGTSTSGKTVKFRKWYHSVPQSQGGYGDPDVIPADVSKLESVANQFPSALSAYGLIMGTPAGRFAGTSTIRTYYGNHQRPRGRRRPPLVKANGGVGGVLGDIGALAGDVISAAL